MQEILRDLHVRKKKTCSNVLFTCKATSLSKIAKLVWRCSDDAKAIIENTYRFCIWKELSLNRVMDRTTALTGVSRSTAQKLLEEKKKAHDEQQQPKQPPSSTVESVTG